MSLSVWKALFFKLYSIRRKNCMFTAYLFLMPFVIFYLVTFIRNKQNTEQTPESLNKQQEINITSGDIHEAVFHQLYSIKGLINPSEEANKELRNENQSEENRDHSRLTGLLYYMLLMASLINSWQTPGALASDERQSGTIERMRMSGVSEMNIVLGYLVYGLILQLILSFIVSAMVMFPLGSDPLLVRWNFLSVYVVVLIQSLHTTAYFLALASFFNSILLREIVSVISYCLLIFWISTQDLSGAADLLCHLLAPLSMFITMHAAASFETSSEERSGTELLFGTSDISIHPLIVALIVAIIGILLEILIFFYMLNVKPGQYGSAKPYLFFLPVKIKKVFLPAHRRVAPSFSDARASSRKGLFEEMPSNVETAIKIENLTKNFGAITAVNNLSVDIYSGQITALLGHNGAGKTTTLMILSGMLSATHGSIKYKGYNILKNMKRFRKDLGLCPQHNLLHPNLMVLDQLIFYGMLAGYSMKEAKKRGMELLTIMGIVEKSKTDCKHLSGGMQRKLCIALALLGDPTVVILDEPTAGVDTESRREIWNILLGGRGDRIILLTTHFMEEADALGDQIAIMSNGEIVCYGSSLFLKKKYGAGYQLSVSCDKDKFQTVADTVRGMVPESKVGNVEESWINFKLPFQDTGRFSDMFRALESNDGVTDFTLRSATMEDVYLK